MYDIMHYPKDKSYTTWFHKVLEFLNKQNEDQKFLFFHWSRWEWMFARGSFEKDDLSNNVLFLLDGIIKAMIIFEDDPNVYFAIYEDNKQLKTQLAEYFNQHYPNKDLVIPQDQEMIELLQTYGYEKTDWIDPVTKFDLDQLKMPETLGYNIVSLEKDYRLDQIHYALYRGFNHGDDITYSKEKLLERKHETSSPHFKKKYTYVAIYDNQYVAYAGAWYKPNTKTALIEPVATVPEHRKKHLARACVYQAIKAVVADGAKYVFVGSNMKVYLNMGFKDFDFAIRFKKISK
jgi:N-acetylglutamate synthase-like GNAT family acetyltransferase